MDLVAVNDLITHRTATAHEEIKGAIGQALSGDNLGQRPGASGNEVRRLEDHGVTKGQRRRDFPDSSRHREVPRADDCDNTHRFTSRLDLHPRAYRIGPVIDLPMHLSGKIMKELPRAVDLSDAFCPGFTLLASQQLTKLGTALNQLVTNGHEHLVAGLHRRHPPFTHRTVGGRQRVVHMLRTGLGVFTDHVIGVGGIGVHDGVSGGDPVTVDI